MRAAAVRIALAVAVAGAVTSGCARGRIDVVATFDDVGDLQERHSVQVADVRVGHVADIRLTDDHRAEVVLSLGAGQRVPRASEALVRTTSLLGEKFIELRPLGDPAAGPFLADGDRIARTGQAPELEFVAQEAVEVLGGVMADDVATIVDTGATAVDGRSDDLAGLLQGVAALSRDLAARAGDIGRTIDALDRASATLAEGAPEVDALLANLATTSGVLADNRDRVVDLLRQVNRIAAVQGPVLDRHYAEVDQQLEQIDAILAAAASQQGEVDSLLGWLSRFVLGFPRVVPADFTQVYAWLVPAESDPRVGRP